MDAVLRFVFRLRSEPGWRLIGLDACRESPIVGLVPVEVCRSAVDVSCDCGAFGQGGSRPSDGRRKRRRCGGLFGSMRYPLRWMTTWWWNQHNVVRLSGSCDPPWDLGSMWWGWGR